MYNPNNATLDTKGNIAASLCDIVSGFSPLVSKCSYNQIIK